MRKNVDRRMETRADMRAMTLMLSASLFIALLAFMIVLNSFASVNAVRVNSVRSSLISSFSFTGNGATLNSLGVHGLGSADTEQANVAAGLRSIMPDIGFETRQTEAAGRIMSIKIPRAQLEDRWDELKTRLADVMRRKGGATGYALQILALENAPDTSILAQLADDMAEEGVSPVRISIGLENKGQNAIEFRFVPQGY